MCKKLDNASSDLVLSAIFYLQQENGVSEKEITKFISKKLGCKQSTVSSEVKEALDRAIETGVFTRKQGLYRIDSSLGNDLRSIKKSLAREKRRNDAQDMQFDMQEEVDASFNSIENTDDRWLNSRSSKSDRISLDKLNVLKNKGKDDDDDEEDFLEDEDDELDFFEDDQFPQICQIKSESQSPEKSRGQSKRNHKQKSTLNKRTRRKSTKINKRIKRRKLACTCKSSEFNNADAPVKSSEKVENEGGEPDKNASKQNKRTVKQQTNDKPEESETKKRGKRRKKTKDQATDSKSGLWAKKETKVEDPKVSSNSSRVVPKEDQTKKTPTEDQVKRKGKEVKNNEEKEVPKTGEETNPKKDPKEHVPEGKTKTVANPNGVPAEREWRRKKAKRERSSSLFRPIKKKVERKESSNAKSSGEQKSAKQKTAK